MALRGNSPSPKPLNQKNIEMQCTASTSEAKALAAL